MKELFSTTMINTGGRAGYARDPEGSFAVKIAPPDKGNKEATNPEQLFAAGYSSCFNGALSLVLKLDRIRAESTVSVTVTLHEGAEYEFFISAVIEGHIEGLSKEDTEKYLQKAHQVCPYSKATQGNIEVTLKAV